VRRVLAAVGPLVVGAACSRGAAPVRSSAPERMTLTSPAFVDGATIPARYTCDGENVAPPLSWSRPPAGTRAVALTVEDPDAPGGTFVHWVVLDLPADATSVPPGTPGYRGPCPPKGDRPHRYVFTVWALREPVTSRQAIGGAAIARGVLVGRYGR
jgi:phosphatidylethanolamine-binding protein (PEBP) family uncharacterized protein